MTSFGWKRKAGAKVSRTASSAFEEDTKDEDAALASGDVDWLTLAPQKRAMVLEDAVIKSNRLKQEGTILAESERFWEALRKWDQAIQLNPEDEKLMEMKAQAYMHLNEVYPAVQAAEKTVEIKPLWWVGYQTLGRARLGLGEVRMAIKCFSRAIHLNPAESSLWHEDLQWSVELLSKKNLLEQEALVAAERDQSSKIIELDDPDSVPESQDTLCLRTSCSDVKQLHVVPACNTELSESIETMDEESANSASSTPLQKLPQNYIVMRD